jgi:hypothetical protein
MMHNAKYIVVSGPTIRKKWLRYLGYYTLPEIVSEYEVWDISSFCRKHDNITKFDDEVDFDTYINEIENVDKFREKLYEAGSSPMPTYVFPLSTRHSETIDVWQASQETSLRFCIKEHKDHPPNPFLPVSLWGKGRRVKQKIQWAWKNVRLACSHGRPHRAFYATPKFIAKWGALDGFATRNYIHNLNYDKILALDRRSPRTESYAVYLDQNFPNDHQLQVNGKSMMTEEEFWGRMQALFKRLKAETGVEEVVICAHPNRDQESIDTLSSFCRVVQFQTEKWVRDCALVVAHSSTALDFAVVFAKPTCFVELPEMRRYQKYTKRIRTYADKLGRKVNVLADSVPNELDWGKDSDSYDHFRKNFIKHPNTPDVKSWKYIVKRLDST